MRATTEIFFVQPAVNAALAALELTAYHRSHLKTLARGTLAETTHSTNVPESPRVFEFFKNFLLSISESSLVLGLVAKSPGERMRNSWGSDTAKGTSSSLP